MSRQLELNVPAAGILDDPAVCIQINAEWLDALMTATERLEFKQTWIDGADMEYIRGEIAKYVDYLVDVQTCPNQNAPYWDSDDGSDATGETDGNDGFPFYYAIYSPDQSLQENIEDWFIAAYVAIIANPETALLFLTQAKKFRLKYRTNPYGGIVDILLNGTYYDSVDTYSASPGILDFDVIVPSPVVGKQELRQEFHGDHNIAATPNAAGDYTVEFIRKQLSESELNMIVDIRFNGANLEYQTADLVWHIASGGQIVRRDANQTFDIALTGTNTLAVQHDSTMQNVFVTGASSTIIAAPLTLANGNPFAMVSTLSGFPQNMIRWLPQWANAVLATRRARLDFDVYDWIGAQRSMRIEAMGGAPGIGFLGANAALRQIIAGDHQGNVASKALASALATFGLITDNTTLGATMSIDFRQNPDNYCQLEYSTNGGGSWELAFDYALCGITGDPPPDWIIDDPGTIAPEAPHDTFTWENGETTVDAAIRTLALCAAVVALVDAMLDAFVEAKNEQYNTITLAAAALALAVAIAAIVITGGAALPIVLGMAVASAALYFAAAYAASITDAQANDPAVRAELACMIFLNIRARAIAPATLQTALQGDTSCLSSDALAVRPLLNDMLNSPYRDDLYMGFIQALGGATLAARSGAELTECVACDERAWCYEWRNEALQEFFNKSAGDWSANGLNIGAADGGGNWGAQLTSKSKFYVPPETTVTMMQFYYVRFGGTNQSYAISDQAGTTNSGGYPVTEGWYQIAGSYSKSDELLGISAGISTNGVQYDGYIAAVRLYGTGVPLFDVCDNCI